MNFKSVKEEICEKGLMLWQLGYCASNDGNISVRAAENVVVITPTGVSKRNLTPETLIEVSLSGEILYAAGGTRPTSELAMHLRCYRDRAETAFYELVTATNARRLLISYSTEGTIPFHRLIEICAERGKVSLVTNEYITYRGGRQSPYRLNNNVEFVVIVDTEKKSTGGDIAKIESRILYRKLLLQAKKAYSKERLKKLFDADPVTHSIMFRKKNDTCRIDTDGLYKIDGRSLEKAIEGISEEGMRGLYDRLRCCECRDVAEQIEETVRIVLENEDGDSPHVRLLPALLKKICYRKYHDLYRRCRACIKTLQRRRPGSYARIAEKIREVEDLSVKRFTS